MMMWYTAEGEEEWTEQDQVSLQSTFAFVIILFFKSNNIALFCINWCNLVM